MKNNRCEVCNYGGNPIQEELSCLKFTRRIARKMVAEEF